MKRIVSLILILCMLLSFSSIALAAGTQSETPAVSEKPMAFSDMVPKDYWSYEALTAAINAGLMQGDAGRLKPNDDITRAEMITSVLRALGLNDSNGWDLSPVEADISSFTDVHKNDWFYDEIAMAYKLKLLTGLSGTAMSPYGIVTREQAFTVLCRLMNLKIASAATSVLNRFTDSSNISSWAKPYVAAMVEAGYVSGSAGVLNPGGIMTRQQFAQVMYNLFKTYYIGAQASADALDSQSVTGNMIINADNITLSNLIVNGDVVIGDGVGDGIATMNHVTINGRLIVRGGGENSIYLKNTTARIVVIEKLSDGGVHIFGDDGSSVDYVEVPDGNDAVIIECSVSELSLSGNNLDVVVNGSVKNVKVSGDKIAISGTGTVVKVSLEEGVKEVSIATANTYIINNSRAAVTVSGKDGKAVTVNLGMQTNTDTTGEIPGDTDQGNQLISYSVNFHSNGGGALASRTVAYGGLLSELPVPSKENAIFIGWFTDDGTFKNEWTVDIKISANLDLYAFYLETIPMLQTNEQTTASVMDVDPDYTMSVLSSDTSMTADDVKAAVTLETLSENISDFGGISVTGSAGSYIIAATNEYSAGCSYALTLSDDKLTFDGKDSTVRTYNVSIKNSDPVLNLKLNSSVKPIPHTEITSITQNGQNVESIFSPLYTVGNGNSLDTLSGTFVYSGSQQFSIGDKLAVYKITPPDDREATEDYTDDPINYVTVTEINGSTISYEGTDSSEVVFIPDVLPVNTADDKDSNFGTVTILIEKMTYAGEAFDDMGLNASTTVDPGDFIAFYTGTLETAESPTYAKITSVTVVNGDYVIGIVAASKDNVMNCMDMSGSQTLDFNQLSDNIDIENAAEIIEEQVQQSGFAQAAADYLVALADADDETREQVCDALDIESFTVEKSMGTYLVGLDSVPTVSVSASISSTLKHFSGSGLRAAISVTCEVKLGEDLKLSVSGTFVEEFKVDLSVSCKLTWGYKYGILRLNDVRITANLDLYNYTYLSLNMTLYSEDEAWSDGLNIKDSIEKLTSMTGGTFQSSERVREFYELYKEMMSKNHDYFDLVNIELCKVTGGIDPLHILAYGFTVEFVVSLDADVSLGTEFSYEKATRYTYSLSLMTMVGETSQTTLADEQYSFTAYAMGTLGIRAGLRLTLEIGFIDVSLNSIGISAEVGAYWQIWGFIYYKLQHKNGVTTTQSGGGCYMELGIYLTIKFLAQVGDAKLVSYNKTLYNHNWPLWSAGSQYYTFDFDYILTNDNNYIKLSGDIKSYSIPSSYYQMVQMDYKTGIVSAANHDAGSFAFSIQNDANQAFSVSSDGVITVTPPADSDAVAAALVITWSQAPLSFTSAPLKRTIYLIWGNPADSYTLNFDTNGGGIAGSLQLPFLAPLGLPQPGRQGYMFDGWYTDDGTFMNKFTSFLMPAKNQTLYAKWVPTMAMYHVFTYLQSLDGSHYDMFDMNLQNVITGSVVTPAVKSYPGFTAPAAQTITVAGDNSTTVSYYYTRNSYTLTFDPNNGMKPIVSTYKAGTPIVPPSVFKEGYDFYCWNQTVQGALIEHVTIPETMIPEDMTFTARWSLKPAYGLVYYFAGGGIAAQDALSYPSGYTIESNDIVLGTPVRSGKTFAGWTGTGLTAPTKTVIIPKGSTGNRYYTATWK